MIYTTIVPANDWYAFFYTLTPPYYTARKVAVFALFGVDVIGMVATEDDPDLRPAPEVGGHDSYFYGNPSYIPQPRRAELSERGELWARAISAELGISSGDPLITQSLDLNAHR